MLPDSKLLIIGLNIIKSHSHVLLPIFQLLSCITPTHVHRRSFLAEEAAAASDNNNNKHKRLRQPDSCAESSMERIAERKRINSGAFPALISITLSTVAR